MYPRTEIATERLVLIPTTAEQCAAILRGDPTRRRGGRRLADRGVAPYRGRGFGSELLKRVSQWLLARKGITRVVARHVPVENVPSQKALESAGFVLEKQDEQHAWYALG
jgi:RimJ/RimL family protein N-acetyltransferase